MALQAGRGRTPTLRMRTQASRAFTYIEMLVVLAIMLMLISVVRPNLVILRQGQNRRQFKEKLRVFASEARLRAVNQIHTVSLGYDKTAKAFRMTDEAADGTTTDAQTLELPDGVTTGKFSADKDEAQGDVWRVPIYADGLSAGGGVEFQIGDEAETFLIDRGTGMGRWTTDKLDDMPPDRWKAGSYAKRT